MSVCTQEPNLFLFKRQLMLCSTDDDKRKQNFKVTLQRPRPLTPNDLLLDVHQNVWIEAGCWSPPLLRIAVSDRGITDLLNAISTSDVGNVVTKLEGARVGNDGLKAVLRGLGFVYHPG